MTAIPFQVAISDSEINRLKRKIEDTRLPEKDIVEGAGWDYGADLTWVKSMKEAWLAYDWRIAEEEINSWPNFKSTIEDVELHFIHARSERSDAVPIVLLHGWPGTFYEFHRIIDDLRHPEDPEKPAFHVIVPSIPGFGFSSTPHQRGWTVKDSARVINTLMTDILGYKDGYLAQGGDWGSLIATSISQYPSCKLVHLNMCVVQPPNPIILFLLWLLPSWLGQRRLTSFFLSEYDLRQLQRSKEFAFKAGYFFTQATQPFQIGLALNDSPIGLLIWIGSKYHEHIDPQNPLSPQELLTTLSIYFFTQTFASSCLPYHENSFKEPLVAISETKLGVSVFDHDILIMPKSWIEQYHKKSLVFYRVHDRGGHFPALDNPNELVDDLREFAEEYLPFFTKSL